MPYVSLKIVSSVSSRDVRYIKSERNDENALTWKYRRYDISTRILKLLEPYLLGKPAAWECDAQDKRRFINAVFWILLACASWRNLPPEYEDQKHTSRSFC